MFVRLAIFGAAFVVTGTAVALGDYWTVLCVVGVLFAIGVWKPSWVQMRPNLDVPKDPVEAAVKLEEHRRWRRVLVPVSGAAVILNGLAYHRVIVDGEGWEISLMMTLVGFALCAWTAITQRAIEAHEQTGA